MSLPCIYPFSIQQNIFIGPPSSQGDSYAYWAQNVIVVYQNGSRTGYATAGFDLFDASGNLLECYPKDTVFCAGVLSGYQGTSLSTPWTMTTQIVDGRLVVANPFGSHTFSTPMPDGALVNLGYGTGNVATSAGTTALAPELILVGPEKGLGVTFDPPTSGSVQAAFETSGESSPSSSVTLIAQQHSDSKSQESSLAFNGRSLARTPRVSAPRAFKRKELALCRVRQAPMGRIRQFPMPRLGMEE